MRILHIRTSTQIPFNIVHLAAGHRGFMLDSFTREHAIVEIYDAREPATRAGTFIARYRDLDFLDTTTHGDLILNPQNPQWRIDAATLSTVRRWVLDAITDSDLLTGPEEEHTLHADLAADLMAVDIADVRANDIIIVGTTLVRRVPATLARAGQRYRFDTTERTHPYTRLDNSAHFAVEEGALVLILRPLFPPGPNRLTRASTSTDVAPDAELAPWTVVGFRLNDEIVVTGVIRGTHDVHGGDITHISEQGCWAGHVTAPTAEAAQTLASATPEANLGDSTD